MTDEADEEFDTIETLATASFESAVGEASQLDVERVRIHGPAAGDYIGLRLMTVEDPAEACAYIIRHDGQNTVGVLWDAGAARQIAAALLNAADLLDGSVAFTVPDTLEGLNG